MKYKRTPVTTKEIVKYIQLRVIRLREDEFKKREKPLSEHKKLVLWKRKSELDRLLGIIFGDKIKKEIQKMKGHNYKQFKQNAVQDGRGI